MKKIFLLATVLVTYTDIFAQLSQANWRWRNDDGPQATATWKANENTQITLTSNTEILRLRIEVYNNTGSAAPVFDTLQYATSTAGPWINLDTLAGTNPFMIATTSAFVVQDEPTTAQLAGVAFSFTPGKVMVDSMVLKNFTLPNVRRTEFEWAITGTSNTATNTTYYFRHWGTTTNLPGGMTYPSLTTGTVLPIKLTSFSVSREAKKVKLEWSTASEQNNARFEIQRSSDAATWKTIANITGHGTTALSNAYNTYDESPLNGINYYVIKQYDGDGRSYRSDVKFVLMPDGKPIVSVYPNPARGSIHFSIVNKGASDVEAILISVNGTPVHREMFKSVPANKINTLHLAYQPPAGVYILKLRTDDFSESLRVIIE